MANAIKKISVQRGYDVTRYVLSTFGGAGGQHACAVADALGMTSVLIHPLAGVLAAYGIGLADVHRDARAGRRGAARRTAWRRASPDSVLGPLEESARAELTAQGADPATVRVTRRAHLRYDGTDTPLAVPYGPAAEMTAAFEQAYRRQFSFLMRDKPIVVEAVSVEAASTPVPVPAPAPPATPALPANPAPPAAAGGHPAEAAEHVRMFTAGEWATGAAVPPDSAARRAGRGRPGDHRRGTGHDRGRAGLAGGGDGPAGPAAHPGRRRALARRRAGTEADPVLLEVFSNLFMSVAEQMGERLQSTAHSVNIKERLDFSCAIFDADGDLIANAPHIPVHLGSMGESIKMVISRNKGRMKPGDVYVAQRPLPRRHAPSRRHRGHPGLRPALRPHHRPEAPQQPEIWFYVASRGHHAEIGGVSPGSMPANSTRIEEEGVLIDNWLLVEDGEFREAADAGPADRRRIPVARPGRPTSPTCAPRSPPTRRAPRSCAGWSRQYGLDVVRAYMAHVQENAAEAVRNVITALRDGELRLRDRQRRADPGAGDRRPRRAARPRSTSPARRRSWRQLQRPVERGHGRRALRLPHPGRQGHPAERRLPAAADRDHPAGHDAVTRSTRPRSPPATSRPARRSPAPCTPPSGTWPRARGR